MLEKGMITVFTPTYNRAHTLPRLYHSLCRQTDKHFQWLVVDDGSTDNTDELIKMWEQKSDFMIKYIYQENSGKQQAHNLGVKYTVTELFVCVDSDDYLIDTAVEIVLECWKKHKEGIGILCKRGFDCTCPVTTWKGSIEYATLLEAAHTHKLHGDTMLVFRTDIIKKFSFPKFENEKFIPESYLYDLMDQEGKLFFLPKILYLCEYQYDGYTANIRRMNAENPNGYLAYIRHRLELDTAFFAKIKDTIRYIAIKCVQKDGGLLKDAINPILVVFLFVPGWLFYRKVYYRLLRRK